MERYIIRDVGNADAWRDHEPDFSAFEFFVEALLRRESSYAEIWVATALVTRIAQEDQQLRRADPAAAQLFSPRSRTRRQFQGSLLLHAGISGNFRRARSRGQLYGQNSEARARPSGRARLSPRFWI